MNLIHGVRRKTVQSLEKKNVLKCVQEEMIEKLDQEVEVCYVVGLGWRVYHHLEHGLLQEYNNNENVIGDEDGAIKTKDLNATNIAKAKFQKETVAKITNEWESLVWKLLYSCDQCFWSEF